MKIEGHEIADMRFDGLQAGLVLEGLGDGSDGRLEVGLSPGSA
jgi:hypothetical protein